MCHTLNDDVQLSYIMDIHRIYHRIELDRFALLALYKSVRDKDKEKKEERTYKTIQSDDKNKAVKPFHFDGK